MTDFNFHTIENSSDQVKEILTGIKEGYGFVPNLFGYMAEAPTTLQAYSSLNKLVSESSLTPAQQQVSLLAVSVENGCDFCSVAHQAMGKMHKSNPQTIDALTSNTKVEDAKDHALTSFARAVTKNRGYMSDEEINTFLDAGFSKQQILEVILIVSIKTLSNYINHLTKPEPNSELLAMI